MFKSLRVNDIWILVLITISTYWIYFKKIFFCGNSRSSGREISSDNKFEQNFGPLKRKSNKL